MSKICRDLKKVHPYIQDAVKAIISDCKAQGLKVAVFETLRTFERQKWLKSNGKSKTLNSYHRLGLAVDIVFKTPKGNWTWRKAAKHWDKLAEIMENHGLRSLWKRSGWDGPHCELRFKGVPTATLYKELKKCDGDVERFWEEYIDTRLGIEPEMPSELEAAIDSALESDEQLMYEVRTVPVEDMKFDGIEAEIRRNPTPKLGFWAWFLSLFGGKR